MNSFRFARPISRPLIAVLLGSLALMAEARERVEVNLETSMGVIALAIDIGRAPRAASYFLSHVDRGDYDKGSVYRSASLDRQASPQFIQGGMLAGALDMPMPVELAAFGVYSLLADWEGTTESTLRHVKGSVSLARDLLATGQVLPEFVICLRDAPELDAGGTGSPDGKGYPVIGEVVAGWDVLTAIAGAELGGTTRIRFLDGQILAHPVSVLSASRRQAAPGKGDQR